MKNKVNAYKLFELILMNNQKQSKKMLLNKAEVFHLRGRLTDLQYAEIIKKINKLSEM